MKLYNDMWQITKWLSVHVGCLTNTVHWSITLLICVCTYLYSILSTVLSFLLLELKAKYNKFNTFIVFKYSVEMEADTGDRYCTFNHIFMSGMLLYVLSFFVVTYIFICDKDYVRYLEIMSILYFATTSIHALSLWICFLSLITFTVLDSIYE